MGIKRTLLRSCACVLLAVLPLVGLAGVAKDSIATVTQIRIDNFGKINTNYYRGAQPDDRDYRDLAALGVRTVIDLTRDGGENEWSLVQQTEMKFYRKPLTKTKKPSPPAETFF